MSDKLYSGLRRFMVDEIRPVEGRLSIGGQEARHISRVLRLGPGDRLILVDKGGARFLARVESSRAQEVVVSIQEALQAPSSSPAEIALCQAILRSGPMDIVIQKATELGVSRVFPFFSERTLVRADEKARADKRRHWEEIARSATKQSDRDRPPEIFPPVPFSDLLTRLKTGEGLKVVLWEGEDRQDLKTILRAEPSKGPKVSGIVGPEGGFAAAEIDAARSAGFLPASMGQRIMRAETASIAFVAVLQYEWGDLGSRRSEGRDHRSAEKPQKSEGEKVRS
jgi:16S rRNA (uracil1498-N3)-methyltransferase